MFHLNLFDRIIYSTTCVASHSTFQLVSEEAVDEGLLAKIKLGNDALQHFVEQFVRDSVETKSVIIKF